MEDPICSRCERALPIRSRGLCNSCYIAWRRKSNPEAAKAARVRYAETHGEHVRQYQRQWYEQNREKIQAANAERYRSLTEEERRDRILRSTHGITLEDYQRMYDAQNGLCAICEREQLVRSPNGSLYLHVDHDHQTGAIRGLLCNYCNTALGHVEKDDWLERALTYLKHPV